MDFNCVKAVGGVILLKVNDDISVVPMEQVDQLYKTNSNICVHTDSGNFYQSEVAPSETLIPEFMEAAEAFGEFKYLQAVKGYPK